MTEQELAEIRQRWLKAAEHRCPECNARPHRESDVVDLLAEVRRLQEKLQYEETCHAEAEEEVRRLNYQNTEQKKVIDATFLYMKHINSPLCLGWDNLLDAMQNWRKYLESEVGK